jgi:hypothetical protein
LAADRCLGTEVPANLVFTEGDYQTVAPSR